MVKHRQIRANKAKFMGLDFTIRTDRSIRIGKARKIRLIERNAKCRYCRDQAINTQQCKTARCIKQES